MLNLSKLFIALIITFFSFLTASAQGEWKWANYWTGNDDPLNSTNPYNYVVRTAFDDDGNVYVFGSFGGSAQLYDQTLSTWICDNVAVATANTQGCILVKYDSTGNYLWSRTIKKAKQGECRPYDMVLRDGKIVISGQYSFSYSLGEQLCFLDTLITEQTALSYPSGEYHPPYTFIDGLNTFISCLDLDGNVLENHFVKTLSRAQDYRLANPINSGFGDCPMCVDSYGNIYMATGITYGGPDTLPWTVVIDEDATKTYDFYLPGYSDMPGINNMMLFKFSQNFDLLWTKLVVDYTVGVAPPIPIDTINPYYTPYVRGLNIDDEDNLYLSGYLMNMWIMDAYNEYPMSIYWDSNHYATVLDQSLAWSLPFIIKYDSDGDVQWANQAYVKNEPSTDFYNFMVWHDNFVDDSGVYLMGQAGATPGQNPLFYFDNESNYLPLLPNTYQHTSFFVKFDKETGAFDALGQTPGLHTFVSDGALSAVVNNHLLGMFQNNFSQGSLLCYFNTNGHFIKADSMLSNDESHKPFKTVVNEDGKILCDFRCQQDINFGNDLTLNFTEHGNSHAVIAYRSDPSILEPYPEDSTAVAQYDERLDRVRLYPNPAADHITIESPEDLPINAVAVTNLAGQLLFIQPVGNTRTEVNVRNLAPGTYIAHINTRAGNTDRKFVVGR